MRKEEGVSVWLAALNEGDRILFNGRKQSCEVLNRIKTPRGIRVEIETPKGVKRVISRVEDSNGIKTHLETDKRYKSEKLEEDEKQNIYFNNIYRVSYGDE